MRSMTWLLSGLQKVSKCCQQWNKGTQKVEIRLIRRDCKGRQYLAVYSMVRLHHFVHRPTGCNVMFNHHSKEAISRRQN